MIIMAVLLGDLNCEGCTSLQWIIYQIWSSCFEKGKNNINNNKILKILYVKFVKRERSKQGIITFTKFQPCLSNDSSFSSSSLVMYPSLNWLECFFHGFSYKNRICEMLYYWFLLTRWIYQMPCQHQRSQTNWGSMNYTAKRYCDLFSIHFLLPNPVHSQWCVLHLSDFLLSGLAQSVICFTFDFLLSYPVHSLCCI